VGEEISKEDHKMRMTVVLEEEEERGYTVYVPSLLGCISQGETREEALKKHQRGAQKSKIFGMPSFA